VRILISCMQCFQETGTPSLHFSRPEIRDDGIYENRCPAGHDTTTFLQQQKFEVLFEVGANAILDGYYREAVSSFTSSLERFYEYALRILLSRPSNSDDLFNICWKEASSQSERQLGAFVFVWATNFGEAPALLPNALVKFRNEVIHKGKIPTKEEALRYGNAVLGVLRPKLYALKAEFAKEMAELTFRQSHKQRAESSSNHPVATLGMATCVSLMSEGTAKQDQSLEGYLNGLAQQRRIFEGLGAPTL